MEIKQEKTKKQLDEQKQEEENYIKKLEVEQFKIKKQPDLYLKEIAKYKADFLSQFQTIKDQPLQKNKKFTTITIFLCRLSQHFKTDLGFLPDYIQEFLNHYSKQMNPYMRHKLVQALIILRSKNVIQPIKSIQFLISLYNCQSKELRKMIQSHLINDFKRMNKHHRNQKINKTIQVYIHEILKNNKDKIAKISLQLMIQLYKRNIWNDDKTVNIIAYGCFNEYYKVKLVSSYFLIETTEPIEEVSDSEEEDPKELIMKDKKRKQFSKKTKASEKKFESNRKKILNKKAKKLKKLNQNGKTFFPIDRIFNPQDYSEKLFGVLRKSTDKFIVKLALMHVISRLIGRHNPHQKEIHKILSYLAEATHDLIPQEDLEPIVKHLIDNFVNDRCTEQSITMGINTIREMCARNKFILDDFNLGYLVDYYSFKNKNVARAAKSLINLFREVNPHLLQKKLRGRINNTLDENQEQDKQYTYQKVNDKIDGAELLQQEGEIPIYMDRILTDEDFKKIRFLQKKKKELEEKALDETSEDYEEEVEDEEDEDEQEAQIEKKKLNKKEKKSQSFSDSSDIEDQKQDNVQEKDCEEDEDEEEEDIEDDDDDDDSNDEEDEDLSEVSLSDVENDIEDKEIDYENTNLDNSQQGEKYEEDVDQQQKQNEKISKLNDKHNKNSNIELENNQKGDLQDKIDIIQDNKNDQKQSQKLKKKNKQRQQELNLDGFSSFEENEMEDENPHNFVDCDKLIQFKKTKAEKRKEQQENTMFKEKKNYGPKPKGGGTTNEQKLKHKPLNMVRPKKNEQFLQKLSTKQKIKELKNKLGHVRSGKQAKQLKLRKLK